MRLGLQKNKLFIFICYAVVVSSLGAAIVAGTKGFDDGLWILPLLYTACFLTIGTTGYFAKYSIIIMNIIAYIRYVLLTYMYYLMNDKYVLPNGGVILSYISEKLSNPLQTVMLMCLEMLVFYVCIFVAARMFFGHEHEVVPDKQYGLLEMGVALVGVLLLMVYPQLIGGYRILTGADASTIWGAFSILVFVAKIYLVMWLFRFVKRKSGAGEWWRTIIALCLIGVLIIEGAVGLTGLISRWGLILTTIPGLYLLQKSYPKYFKQIFIFVGIAGAVMMFIMTASRYDLSGASGEVGFIQRVVNYKTFNSYFAGGVNMEIALQTKALYENEYGLMTMVNDILGACPFINKLLNNQVNNTVYFFNYTIYEGFIAGDQICPIGGQSMLYFGRLGVGILPGLFAVLAVWFERQAERSSTVLSKYIYAFCMGVSAIIMCINVNIWFQYFWQKMLPLIILAKIDYKIRIKK